jgi:anthranilate/para-aminobenzoate synthase component I
MQRDVLRFQAGAGIVYDSTPEREFEESMEKLRANLNALEMLTPAERKDLGAKSGTPV